MSYTLFPTNMMHVYEGDVDDPIYGSLLNSISYDDRYDVLAFSTDEFTLGAGDTRTIPIPNNYASSEWQYLYIIVEGEVNIETTALDYDNVTSIKGRMIGYGNSDWPGHNQLTTYNVSEIEIEGVSSSNRVRLLWAVIVEPDDVRL